MPNWGDNVIRKYTGCTLPTFVKHYDSTVSPPFFRTCFSMGDLDVYPGCLVSATPRTVFTDVFETLHVFSSWYEDVHVVWI